MRIRHYLLAAALASVLAVPVARAEATNPDQDCDDIMSELKELNDGLLKSRGAAGTPMAACGALGQLLGVAKASRAVADECYDNDKKRQEQVASYEKVTKDLEAQLGASCK
jgi:hypothetical protein